ncbi:MAG: histidine--tRNA ligase [Oscillospiraceae bacterium]|nr:histidine--tRNA ligase [Oscillospiraceae bacterium]
MERIKPHTLSGFMELLPAPQMQMERIMAVLRKNYASFGFTALDTPAIESSDVLLAKGGGDTEKQIYRFQKGDSDLSLRFDLTVPLAKYVALHYAELAFPFRRYQIGKVYRGERAQRGRFREFYQADIDIIGDGKLDILNEAEIPSIIYRTFRDLGLTRFQIRVNNRKLLTGFYAMQGLEEKSGDIMRTVDKLDKIGAEKVKKLLMDKEIALTEAQADEILRFIAITGSNTEVLTALQEYKGRNEIFDAGLEELNTVTKYLAAFGVPEENFAVDLTIARGLDYYTGTVYETTLLDHPEIGSVCSGGRYDNLAEYYTDKQLPGVGISIGLTRLFYVLGEQGLLNADLNTAPCDVLVLPMTENTGAVIATATAFREAGLRVQLYSEQKKFKQKMNYADKLSVPFVLILGDNEIADGTVGCKNMVTGEQITVSPADAIAHIKDALAEREKGAIILEK